MSNFFLRAANRLFGDFVQRRRDRILNSRRAQQEYDTQRLYLLTEFRKQLDELKRKGESFPEHMPLPSQDQLPILELQMETLQQSVSDQLVHTLDAVHENCGVLTDVHHGQQKIQEKLGFCTSVKTSTANGAGNGLFLQGDALPGTVVGFHPGIVYLLLDLNKLPNFPHVDKENPYLFSRLDGAVLDAKGWEILLKRDPNHPRFSDVTSHYVDHPFAKGHLINHPPKDIRPNVMQYCEFDSCEVQYCWRKGLFGHTSSVEN
eukprot:TRINITY_DN4381_c0_g1_i1.p1 TRINITY_DN4381_c0_g1~~TRINITY_DN4381_c0_g1_i1.p1  ORF type:complete len:261 (+),score=58.01 TRINITY_DN4381_c0_g1_i1:73-855(+)